MPETRAARRRKAAAITSIVLVLLGLMLWLMANGGHPHGVAGWATPVLVAVSLVISGTVLQGMRKP